MRYMEHTHQEIRTVALDELCKYFHSWRSSRRVHRQYTMVRVSRPQIAGFGTWFAPMVNFGEQLNNHAVRRWRQYYVDYRTLKTNIARIADAINSGMLSAPGLARASSISKGSPVIAALRRNFSGTFSTAGSLTPLLSDAEVKASPESLIEKMLEGAECKLRAARLLTRVAIAFFEIAAYPVPCRPHC